MKITSLTTHRIRLPFSTPMITSYGRYDTRLLLLVRIESSDGLVGWGECSALEDASYFWETADIARTSVVDVVTPRLVGADVAADEVVTSLDGLSVGPMTMAAVEMAILDAELQAKQVSLADHLGARENSVMASVAIGIPADRSVSALLDQVEAKVTQGIRGLKLKIEPGWDVEPVAAIRQRFGPEIGIIVDANGSFAGQDLSPLHGLSELKVILEQPLAKDDFEGHAALVAAGVGQVCLDESVEELADAKLAVEMRAAHMLCLKPSRVGGLLAMRTLQEQCDQFGIETRVGGMYSSALGSVVEKVLAAGRPQSDIMPAGMRWKDGVDLTPLELLKADGTVDVPSHIGITPADFDTRDFVHDPPV